MWTAGPTIAGVKHEQTAMAPARAGQPGSAYEALLLPSRCCVARDKRHDRGRSLEGGRPAARSAAGRLTVYGPLVDAVVPNTSVRLVRLPLLARTWNGLKPGRNPPPAKSSPA